MGSSLFEQLASAQALVLRDAFGTAGATYTAPDGIASSGGLTVRVQRNEASQVPATGKLGELQTAEIIVLQADLPSCVKDARFSVPGPAGPEVWTIETTPLLQNGEWICTCSRASTDRLMPRRGQQR